MLELLPDHFLEENKEIFVTNKMGNGDWQCNGIISKFQIDDTIRYEIMEVANLVWRYVLLSINI